MYVNSTEGRVSGGARGRVEARLTRARQKRAHLECLEVARDRNLSGLDEVEARGRRALRHDRVALGAEHLARARERYV